MLVYCAINRATVIRARKFLMNTTFIVAASMSVATPSYANSSIAERPVLQNKVVNTSDFNPSQFLKTSKLVPISNGFVSLRDRLANVKSNSILASADKKQTKSIFGKTNAVRDWHNKLANKVRDIHYDIAREQTFADILHYATIAFSEPKQTIWTDWQNMVLQIRNSDNPVRKVQELVEHNIRFRNEIGSNDHWQSPLQTLRQGAGDCEDHMILKFALLKSAGFDNKDLQFIMLKTANGLGHAVLKVIGDQDYYLDNRNAVGMNANLLAGDKIIRIFPTHDQTPFKAQDHVQVPTQKAELKRILMDTTT